MDLSYVIKNTELDIDYRKAHIHDLLDLYVSGKDITNSEVAQWGRRTLESGGWWYGKEKLPKEEWEQGIQERQQSIIKLYNALMQYGYTGSTISIYFDKKTGQVHTYDGFHRLSILDYLGIECDLNCKVSYHHPTRHDMRGDFPLRQKLIELNGSAKLYQPIEDERVKDFVLWRPDTQQRLDKFLEFLVPGTVLDIGCETGWFSRTLSRRGYKVTAIDKDPRRVAVTRYLKTILNVQHEVRESDWATFEGNFDNILLLSVLHHDILAYGIEGTKKRLEALRGKCKRLIIEMPLSAKLVKWLPEHKKNSWSFTAYEFIQFIRKYTGMRYHRTVYAKLLDRPIMVFTA